MWRRMKWVDNLSADLMSQGPGQTSPEGNEVISNGYLAFFRLVKSAVHSRYLIFLLERMA